MARIAHLIRGKSVALDTAAFIYYLEENAEYLPVTAELFEAIDRREARGMTSVITLVEVMVKPLREGRSDLADSYREILTDAAKPHALPCGRGGGHKGGANTQ